MNYALAKMLKDAGFLQRKGFDGDNTNLQIRYGFPTYVCEHGNKCPDAGQCGSKVYYPKLAELIDAVEMFGADFAYLTKKERGGKWKACLRSIHGKEAFGDSPEAAVANLWLKSKPPVAL